MGRLLSKTNRIGTLLLLGVVLVAPFLALVNPNTARASILYENWPWDETNSISGGITYMEMDTIEEWSGGIVTDVEVLKNTSSPTTTFEIKIGGTGGTEYFPDSDTVGEEEGTTGFFHHTYHFATPLNCFEGANCVFFGGSGTIAYNGDNGIWAMKVYEGNLPQISYDTDRLYDGREIPDFSYFSICLFFPDGWAEGNYYYTSTYDGDGLDGPVTDDIRDEVGEYPRRTTATSFECPTLTKSEDLSPGEYTFEAKLYDHDGAQLATSGVINITINGLPKTTFVGNAGPVNPAEAEICKQYDPIWFTISSVNVPNPIYQGCKLLTYLLVPTEDFPARLTESKELLYTKTPFSYFSSIYDSVSAISTDEAPPDYDLTLVKPFGESQGDITITFLSADNPLTGYLDNIRPWIITGLWLSFATYLLFRVFSFFRSV